jgi:hypothetical protein
MLFQHFFHVHLRPLASATQIAARLPFRKFGLALARIALLAVIPLASGCRQDADRALSDAERIVSRWESRAARKALNDQDSKDARAQVDEWRRTYGDTFSQLSPEQLGRCSALEARMSKVFSHSPER